MKDKNFVLAADSHTVNPCFVFELNFALDLELRAEYHKRGLFSREQGRKPAVGADRERLDIEEFIFAALFAVFVFIPRCNRFAVFGNYAQT